MPPLLVVVSGLPAAGKTTLSKRLSADLGLPHVCRDRMRRSSMTDVHGTLPPDERWRVGAAVDRLVRYGDLLAAIRAEADGGG